MKFTLDFEPPKTTAQQSTRIGVINGHARAFKSKKGQLAVSDYLTMLLPHKPKEPFTGPVRLVIDFRWSFNKTEKKQDIERGYKWHTSKPDCDNAAKMLKDCMTKAGFWLDDSQVVYLVVTKQRQKMGFVQIEIQSLGDDE